MTSAESVARAAALTGGYGLPEDALELLRDEIGWALDLSEARGRTAERAGVVAFLREWQNTMDDRITHDDLDYAIAVIERGEHLRGEKL